jgi:ketosteroid isomerase-like protein
MQFYAALNRMLNGDAGPLGDIWSHSAAVTTMHPVGGTEVGWSKVSGRWRQVAKVMSGGHVRLSNPRLRVLGDVAYEIGTEQGWLKLGTQRVTIKHRVTNSYRREAGKWRIMHHHTDVAAGMIEALGRLQRKK